MLVISDACPNLKANTQMFAMDKTAHVLRNLCTILAGMICHYLQIKNILTL